MVRGLSHRPLSFALGLAQASGQAAPRHADLGLCLGFPTQGTQVIPSAQFSVVCALAGTVTRCALSTCCVPGPDLVVSVMSRCLCRQRGGRREAGEGVGRGWGQWGLVLLA